MKNTWSQIDSNEKQQRIYWFVEDGGGTLKRLDKGPNCQIPFFGNDASPIMYKQQECRDMLTRLSLMFILLENLGNTMLASLLRNVPMISQPYLLILENFKHSPDYPPKKQMNFSTKHVPLLWSRRRRRTTAHSSPNTKKRLSQKRQQKINQSEKEEGKKGKDRRLEADRLVSLFPIARTISLLAGITSGSQAVGIAGGW